MICISVAIKMSSVFFTVICVVIVGVLQGVHSGSLPNPLGNLGNPLGNLGNPLGNLGNPLANLGTAGNPLDVLGNLGKAGNPLDVLGNLGKTGNPLDVLGNLGKAGNPLDVLGNLGSLVNPADLSGPLHLCKCKGADCRCCIAIDPPVVGHLGGCLEVSFVPHDKALMVGIEVNDKIVFESRLVTGNIPSCTPVFKAACWGFNHVYVGDKDAELCSEIKVGPLPILKVPCLKFTERGLVTIAPNSY